MNRLSARCVRALVGAATLLLGCGSGERTRVVRGEEPAGEVLNVQQDVNVCPRFEGALVLPQTIPPGQPSVIVVRAVDPDDDDSRLTFEWSVSAGELSERQGPATDYYCTEVGPQVLTVVTEDAQGCHVSLALDVTCLE